MSIYKILLLMVSTGIVVSCSTTHLKLNEERLRELLVKASEDQIMDNLIRGKNKQTMVHFDFTHITANVSTKVAGSLDGGQTLTRAVTSTAVRPFTFKFAPERSNVVALEINPVQNKNAIYQAYLDYLDLKPRIDKESNKKVDSLVESNELPPESAHRFLKKDGLWYYVPKEFKEDFFKLSLATTSMREGSPPAKPRILENMIAGFTEGYSPSKDGLSATLGIKFQHEMPVDEGRITLPIDGAYRDFDMKTPGGEKDTERQSTTFNLIYPNRQNLPLPDFEKEIQSFKKSAAGKAVQVWFKDAKTSSEARSYYMERVPSDLQKALEDLGSQTRFTNQLRLLSD